MALNDVKDFKQYDVAFYDGKQVKVVATYTDYVVIIDEFGHESSVRKDALMRTPIFNFQSEANRQERKERIAYFQEKAQEAGAEKKDFLAQIKDLFKQLGQLDKNDEQYSIVKDEYWAARLNKTAAGNREYGYYLDAYLVASDSSNWA